MIAVDTNILVHAHRRDSDWNDAATACLRGLAEAPASWGVPWPCVHEFLAVVTHPRIFDPPSTLEEAVEQLDAWLESPSVVLLGAGPGYWEHFKTLARAARVDGPRVHDARVAALCRAHGVRELWTADRDFQRFPALRTRNPLVDSQA